MTIRPHVLTALLLCALVFPAPAQAQANHITVQASVLRGTLGYAREVSPRRLVGLELGFGFPQVDRTLVPRQLPDDQGPSFEEYFHLGLFLRLLPSERVDVDLGVRASIADLYDSGGSWPEPFLGAYVQPMVGGRRLKVGMRLTSGVIFEPDAGATGVLGLNPFVVRWTF